MSFLTIKNVGISGLSACVPSRIEENRDLHIFSDAAEAQRVIDSTGIERKRVSDPDVTSADLSVQAVNELLDKLEWERDSIDVLIYVSLSRDFLAPNTSIILQDRLGLSQGCYCLDLPVGCAGWIMGMSTTAALLSSGQFKRGLLICAECNSQNRSPKDKTVKPLFGDAATVTALEYNESAAALQFSFGVDGRGYRAVWAKSGGARYPVVPESLVEREVEPGVIRRDIDIAVSGMDVFAFAIKVPPLALKGMIEHYDINADELDFLLLHQSNKYIDERIRKKLCIPAEKVPYSLADYGNTSSASIPLTMITECREALLTKSNKCIACGFGVGLAWGCLHYYADKLKAVHYSEYVHRNESVSP